MLSLLFPRKENYIQNTVLRASQMAFLTYSKQGDMLVPPEKTHTHQVPQEIQVLAI